MLWHVGLRKHIRPEILLLMIPASLVSTPLGQYLQEYTPAPVLKIVIGVLTIGVACWQIFNIIKMNLKKTVTSSAKVKPVYFIIGSQRSGSNWLQLMINERYPQISAPHPAHILENFFNILEKFGNLGEDGNFKQLIDFLVVGDVPTGALEHETRLAYQTLQAIIDATGLTGLQSRRLKTEQIRS